MNRRPAPAAEDRQAPDALVDLASPEARDLAAQRRDSAAQRRDDAALERHMQADLRDVTASRHDERVDAADNLNELRALYYDLQRRAAADRQYAAADRRADAEDRLAAARDRYNAAGDRRASAADRAEASLDSLTGAYNRGAGFKELIRDLDRARRAESSFTVAFVDVDGLKGINDTYGHSAGDRALERVVRELRTGLRAHDLIIRFGGDEFLCAVASMAESELNKRLRGVSERLALPPEPVRITVGLAALQAHESADDLFRRADASFYVNRRRR